jgi:hypothetical protein
MRDRSHIAYANEIRRATSFVNAEWCVEAEGHSILDERKQKGVELIVHVYAGRKF